jgi:hypothetical protein
MYEKKQKAYNNPLNCIYLHILSILCEQYVQIKYLQYRIREEET